MMMMPLMGILSIKIFKFIVAIAIDLEIKS
jgi:hypothetical protein